MATRRMFSSKIVSSARFLKMPIDSQCLYFHLGLHADDDGVVEAYTVMKSIGSSEDNLRVLVSKGFLKILNEDLVAFILDWNEHNLIRADRKVDSIYKNLLLQVVADVDLLEPKPRADTGVIPRQPTGRPLDVHWTAQDRLGKDRLGKVSIEREQPSQLQIDSSLIENLIQKGFPNDLVELEIKKFISYWTEPSRQGKQRWQGEKYFDISRRLATWFSRVVTDNQKKQTKHINLDAIN